MNILFAEDDAMLAQLFQLQAQQEGYQVCWVENGEAAVQEALNYQHDLVLMDIQMPVMDGITAMQLLRQLGFDRPIVAMSAEEVTTTGFDLVLQKPLQWHQIQQHLAGFKSATTQELQVPDELRQAYVNHLQQSLQRLELLATQAQWTEFTAIVHQIKGTAGSFGFERLSELAHQLQSKWKACTNEQKIDQASWFLEQCKACKLN